MKNKRIKHTVEKIRTVNDIWNRYETLTKSIENERKILQIFSLPILFFTLIGIIRILQEPNFNFKGVFCSIEQFVFCILILVYCLLMVLFHTKPQEVS